MCVSVCATNVERVFKFVLCMHKSIENFTLCLLLKKSNTRRTSFLSSKTHTHRQTRAHLFDVRVVFVVFVVILADLSAFVIYILSLGGFVF